MTAVVCTVSDCSTPLPVGRRAYCSDRCSNRAKMRRQRGSAKAAADAIGKAANGALGVLPEDSLDGRSSARRGERYDAFIAMGGPAMLDERGWTHQAIADHFEVERPTVTRWLAAYRQDLRREQAIAAWKRPAEADASLEDFKAFRTRYFTTARGPMKGRPPATTRFHLRWITGILEAISFGGKLMVLSPPRHGKSLLMAHFVIWMIVRNPDIAIIWVAGNENTAERFGSLIRDELERNALLAADFIGPGGSFKPLTRTGMKWTDTEFEVSTRTVPQPAPTFKAIGRGGRMLSFDADLIVTDDIEDHKSTQHPSQRQATDDWFHTDLASRKEEHTAWVYIGSRQHPEDLASKLLDSEEWDTIVETAHAAECSLPEDDYAAHVDCVLWPELRNYRFLQAQRRTIGDIRFEMNFLNRPRANGVTVFARDAVEGCFDASRVLGDRRALPPDVRLIAGLDPARAGFQAAMLWAVGVGSNTRYLLDLENEKAGGIEHLRSVFERWFTVYQLREWVFEANAAQSEWIKDSKIVELRDRLGLKIHAHSTTGASKHDIVMGVTAMAPLFEQGLVDLPYGDEASRRKVDAYAAQLRNYSTAWRPQAHQPMDLVMAGWFPERIIQSWQAEFIAEMDVDYQAAGGEWATDWNEVPWSEPAGRWGGGWA